MLLKSNTIKFKESEPINDSDSDIDLEKKEAELVYEYIPENYKTAYITEDIDIGNTIVLAGAETRVLETEDDFVAFQDEEEYQVEEGVQFDEDLGVYIAPVIEIGAEFYSGRAVEEEPEEEPEYYQEEEEIDDIESLLDDEDFESDDPEEQARKLKSEEELFVDDFSSAMNSLDEEVGAGIPSWGEGDDFLSDVLKDLKVDDDYDFGTFIPDDEKDRLLAEAVQLISEASGFEEINQVISDLEGYVYQTVDKNSIYLFEEIDEEKQMAFQEIESHIEEVLSRQREEIQAEAEVHIEKTIQYYRAKMEDDQQLRDAATNIISRKEKILDESYARSLKLVEEAEEQASRIIDDAMASNEEAERVISEARVEGERIEESFREEGERIISDSNVESAQIIQSAEEQHQEIVEAATQDGFNVGYQEGREEAIKENAQLLMDTTNALNDLHSAFPLAVKENEGKLVTITLELSKALAKEEILARPELCVNVLDTAVRRVSDLERVLIKVNPLDLDLILPKQEQIRGILADVEDFVITGHYSIERGGCLIETNSGTINAQVTAQLGVVKEIFDTIRNEYDDDDVDEEEDEDEEEYEEDYEE